MTDEKASRMGGASRRRYQHSLKARVACPLKQSTYCSLDVTTVWRSRHRLPCAARWRPSAGPRSIRLCAVVTCCYMWGRADGRFWNSCCRLLNLSSEVVTRCQSLRREIIDGQRAMQNQFPVHRRIMLYRSIFKVREPMRDGQLNRGDSWRALFRHCDGARLSFDQDRFVDVQFHRVHLLSGDLVRRGWRDNVPGGAP